MGKSLNEFGREMAYIMPKFLREVIKRQAMASSAREVTMPQMLILSLLMERRRCKMSEVAKAMSVTTSAATGLVERMVRSSLLRRTPGERDRRVINIEATPKGKSIIETIEKRRYKLMMDMFSKLTPVERSRYLATVKKIYHILTGEKG